MARRRSSCRRRSSTSGRTTKAKGTSSGRRSDGASFKSKGQADFTSSKHTTDAMENGNAGDRKENCDPLGHQSCDPQGKKKNKHQLPLGNGIASSPSPSPSPSSTSPLHRPNHLNNLINVNSGRDSACSDVMMMSSSCSLYTTSSSAPSCDTPSLGSYDSTSRTGTPSMRTPSIRTPSIRTPSLFGSSFDNSSFDASSLEYESNSSSVCGTPVTPRRGLPSHPNAPHNPLELSSSQEESSEESRARKRTEKRKRYRRNRRLRMLAAMHLENLEREKLCKMAAAAPPAGGILKVDKDTAPPAAAGAEMTIEVPVTKNGIEEESSVLIDKLASPTPAVTTFKDEGEDGVDEVVDEGFSENFDKAQRKNLEETIVLATDTSSATETVKERDNNNRELSVDVISIEVEGEVRYHEGEGSLECGNAKDIASKHADGLSQTLKNEMDKITSKVLEKRVPSEEKNEVTEGCADEEGGTRGDDDGREGTDDDPRKEGDSEEPNSGSSSGVPEESFSPEQVVDGTSSTSQSLTPSENKETEKEEPLPSGEEVETIVCTKAVPDEVSSAVVNDNLHLINSFDKLELVDVIETQGYPENLVVLEMKNNADSLPDDSERQDKEQKTSNNDNVVETPKGKVRFAEEEEEVEQVVDIPIIMESGYEEIFPEEHVEVVDVMKAGDGEDGDIVIFEVQNDDEAPEEEEEEEENDAENKPNDEVVDTVVKEATDSSTGEEQQEVEIAQDCLQLQQQQAISTDVDKNVVVGSTNVGDEAKKPAGKVDAALAELDSIPDGVCESGEVEEEEEDEEEWSYYRMEPQTHPQGEDVITSGVAPAAVCSKPAEDIEIITEATNIAHDQDIIPAEEPKAKTEDLVADLIEESTDLIEQPEKNELVENIETPVTVGKTPDNLESKMDMDLIPSLDDHPERLINFSGPGLEKTDLIDTGLEQNSPHGSGSPRAPGSPRSVEGFVTSVELNTADEAFATNFAVNQPQDGFAGSVMDQSSGPFSVYVSSSPEPVSLDPPTQSVDLLNMTSGLTNGQVDDEHPMNRGEVRDESPVEIVHAQSTVEVVAPPSPVDVSGPETMFTMPDQQIPDSPVSAHMPPTDISFVPQPIIEPSAEVPVPVYVDDTPVSEPEIIPDVTQAINATEDLVTVSATEDLVTLSKTEMEVKAENITETLVSNVESFVETTRTEVSEANYNMETEISNHMVTDFEAKEELLQLSSPAPTNIEQDVISVKSPDFETIPNTGEVFVEERTSPVNIEAEKHSQILSPEPVEVKSPEPVEVKSPEPVEVKSPEPVEVKSPEPVEVKSPEPVEAKSPELTAKSPEAVKSPEPAAAKATKAARTPAKSAGEKAATKATPGKATPSKTTPAKATPKSTTTPSSTRTPSTRTPTTRTPLAKSTEKKTPTSKPASPAVASRTAASKPASTRPASAPTSAKPTVSRTAAPKPATTRPAPTKPSTTKSTLTAAKPTTKAAGTTVPKAGSTTRPTTTRPTSASTTTTRKPLDATKSADKADGKLVNGTARPSSRPGTARPTSTTTATRKPLTSTTKTATKSAAEKETKNTTNQILSTRPSKTASTTTKTAASRTTSATHSTSRTTSKVSDSANATKSRVTATTKTTASKTTGAATKKTMVTKSKTSQAGTKETSVKTKTEASVIAKAEPLVNGENKIADEETSVEVLEKCAVEDIMQASTEKMIAETMSSEQMVVTTETTEVLVNGDH